MGQPKLLFLRGGTVIEHVLRVWRDSGVEQVVMVVHPLDDRLAELGAAGGASVVRPETPPPDMKASVRLGLQWVATAGPLACDAWLLAPADMPGLTATAIASLVAAYGANVASEDVAGADLGAELPGAAGTPFCSAGRWRPKWPIWRRARGLTRSWPGMRCARSRWPTRRFVRISTRRPITTGCGRTTSLKYLLQARRGPAGLY